MKTTLRNPTAICSESEISDSCVLHFQVLQGFGCACGLPTLFSLFLGSWDILIHVCIYIYVYYIDIMYD